jgi:predicted RNA-binding protein YlqC (UPF0109 family)
MDYEKILLEIISPFVTNKDALKIIFSKGKNKEIIIDVKGDQADISRLIGQKGNVANSIRELISVPAKMENKRVIIHFDS